MEVGMKVSWTHVSQRGRTLSMSIREGEITAINGGMATIRRKSGKTETIAVRRLRVDGQLSQLGQFVEAMRETHR